MESWAVQSTMWVPLPILWLAWLIVCQLTFTRDRPRKKPVEVEEIWQRTGEPPSQTNVRVV